MSQTVGRRAELALARGLVDSTAAGHGAALLITGEARIGKTRLVTEIAAMAGEAGDRPGDAGRGMYRAVGQALAGALRDRQVHDTPELLPTGRRCAG